ncbi:MAG TPA: nickel-binding protein, partial [Dehalococcoidia bacterium]|nr:nickel-binding protein [Dehalococcoidia bacterium]
MPLFMDVHRKVDGLTKEAVAGAHQRDLEVQGKHGVNYLRYWFNEEAGRV